MFDRFDILSAYYLFGSLYHGGQWTDEYAYMGRAMNCGFKPGPNFRFESLTENGQKIYNDLVARKEKKPTKITITATVVYPIQVEIEVDDSMDSNAKREAILNAADKAFFHSSIRPIITECSDEDLEE